MNRSVESYSHCLQKPQSCPTPLSTTRTTNSWQMVFATFFTHAHSPGSANSSGLTSLVPFSQPFWPMILIPALLLSVKRYQVHVGDLGGARAVPPHGFEAESGPHAPLCPLRPHTVLLMARAVGSCGRPVLVCCCFAEDCLYSVYI